MPEDEGGQRRDEGDVRSSGRHWDARLRLFAVWSHWDMKARGTTRCGRQASDARRSKVGKIG